MVPGERPVPVGGLRHGIRLPGATRRDGAEGPLEHGGRTDGLGAGSTRQTGEDGRRDCCDQRRGGDGDAQSPPAEHRLKAAAEAGPLPAPGGLLGDLHAHPVPVVRPVVGLDQDLQLLPQLRVAELVHHCTSEPSDAPRQPRSFALAAESREASVPGGTSRIPAVVA